MVATIGKPLGLLHENLNLTNKKSWEGERASHVADHLRPKGNSQVKPPVATMINRHRIFRWRWLWCSSVRLEGRNLESFRDLINISSIISWNFLVVHDDAFTCRIPSLSLAWWKLTRMRHPWSGSAGHETTQRWRVTACGPARIMDAYLSYYILINLVPLTRRPN